MYIFCSRAEVVWFGGVCEMDGPFRHVYSWSRQLSPQDIQRNSSRWHAQYPDPCGLLGMAGKFLHLKLGHNLIFSGQFYICTLAHTHNQNLGFNTTVWLKNFACICPTTTFVSFISSCLKFSRFFSCSSGEGALISASGHREHSEVSDSLWSAHTSTQQREAWEHSLLTSCME